MLCLIGQAKENVDATNVMRGHTDVIEDVVRCSFSFLAHLTHHSPQCSVVYYVIMLSHVVALLASCLHHAMLVVALQGCQYFRFRE